MAVRRKFTLDEMISRARGGYPRNRHCIGSDLNFISNSHVLKNFGLLAKDLSKEDLKKIGARVKACREEDFRESVFGVAKKLVKELFGQDLHKFGNPNFKSLSNQADFLRELSLRRHTGVALNSKTARDIEGIREAHYNATISQNDIMQAAYKPINMVLIDGIHLGFNGFITMRAKTDASLVSKQLRNYSLIYNPSSEDIYEASEILGQELSAMDFTNHVFMYLCNLYDEGKDIHKTHEIFLKDEDKHALAFGKIGMKAHLFDAIGLKFSSNSEVIGDLIKILCGDVNIRDNKKREFARKLRIYESRCQDHYGTSNKDGSAVFALNGLKERVNLELRLQTVLDTLEAEFGTEKFDKKKDKIVPDKIAHYAFDDKKGDSGINSLYSGPEANIVLVQNCYALDTTPVDVIGPQVLDLVNEYGMYDEYGFDLDSMKRRLDFLEMQKEEYFKNLR